MHFQVYGDSKLHGATDVSSCTLFIMSVSQAHDTVTNMSISQHNLSNLAGLYTDQESQQSQHLTDIVSKHSNDDVDDLDEYTKSVLSMIADGNSLAIRKMTNFVETDL